MGKVDRDTTFDINVPDGVGLVNSYDRLTGLGKGNSRRQSELGFGGAISSAASHEGTNVLRFTHPRAEEWAGIAQRPRVGQTCR